MYRSWIIAPERPSTMRDTTTCATRTIVTHIGVLSTCSSVYTVDDMVSCV